MADVSSSTITHSHQPSQPSAITGSFSNPTTPTTTIRLVALREQYERLKPRIDAAIASVLDRSAYIAGPEVGEFERWFAAHCGARHALGVSSGTTAIELVLRALGAGPGDQVVIPANTFIAT